IAVPTATSARIGTQRTLVRRTAGASARSTALAAFSIYTVDIPVSRRRCRRVFHRRLDHRRTARRECRAERGTEFVSAADEHAVGAVALRDLREVGPVAFAIRLEQAAELPPVVHVGQSGD